MRSRERRRTAPLQGWFQNRPNPGFHPGLCCCALLALGLVSVATAPGDPIHMLENKPFIPGLLNLPQRL
jgi:hypothetical protein